MSPPRLSPEEAAAIEWLALQRPGRMSAAERQRFERWLAESERHRGAWERLQRRLDSAFAEQPAGLARNTLLSAGTSRRQVLRGALALAGLGLGGLGLTRPGMPLDGLLADLSDSERVLALLEEILPLRIQRYLGWWMSLSPKAHRNRVKLL